MKLRAFHVEAAIVGVLVVGSIVAAIVSIYETVIS